MFSVRTRRGIKWILVRKKQWEREWIDDLLERNPDDRLQGVYSRVEGQTRSVPFGGFAAIFHVSLRTCL